MQAPDVLFRALSDPTRRSLFERLSRDGELTVHTITDQAGVSQPAVSKHLAALKLAGLVRDRREGRETHYSADPPPKSATATSEVKVSTRLPSDGEDTPPATPKQDAPAKKEGDKKAADTDKPATGKVPPEYAERCKILQSNLQTMQDHGRVKMTNDKGEVSVLSDEEKKKQMDDTQRQIKAFCQ